MRFPSRCTRLAAFALVAITASACSGANASSSDAGGIRQFTQGQRPPLPHLTGPTLDGGHFDSDTAKGHVLVVNFWASWCPPCQDEAQGLQQVASDLKGAGVQFLGVDVRDQRNQARTYVGHYGIDYPSIFDPDSSTVLEFREPTLPTSPPTTIVVDRQGRIAATIFGEAQLSVLEPLVRQIAEEKA